MLVSPSGIQSIETQGCAKKIFWMALTQVAEAGQNPV
jgi:hypothetical protein